MFLAVVVQQVTPEGPTYDIGPVLTYKVGLNDELLLPGLDQSQMGYKKILLWTQSELTAARRIYENAGFRKVAEEHHKSWSRKDLVAETWELKV